METLNTLLRCVLCTRVPVAEGRVTEVLYPVLHVLHPCPLPREVLIDATCAVLDIQHHGSYVTE